MSDVDFKVGANSDDANAAFDKLADRAMTTGQRIQTAMREASYKMASGFKESFEKVNTEFGKVIESARKMQGVMLALGTALAGGRAFKEAIDETVNMTKESLALSRALGITVTEASNLSVALGDIYQTSDTLLAGNAKMTRQLNENEGAFKKLGVTTRDQNGNFRNSLDIMLDVNNKLSQFKEGTDRNVEANKIYGKSYQEMLPLIALTGQRLQEAKDKAASLGLTIGKEGVEATAQYRAAMNDVGDVMQAVKKAIGDALMPVLTELGNWFASIGPALVTVFKGAIGGLISVFHGLSLSFKIVWELLSLGFKNLMELGSTFGKVMYAVLHGDFKGATEAATAGFRAMQTNVSDTFDRIVADATATQEKLYNLFANQTPIDVIPGNGAKTSTGKDKKDKKDQSRTGEWEVELAAMRDAFERQKLEQGSFEEFGKARERDYWKNILDTVKLSTEERRQVSSKYYALERDLRKAAFEAEIADLRSQQNAYREGSVERIRIAGEAAARIGDKYGIESKEYKAALDEMRQMALARQKQQEQLDSLALERVRSHQMSVLELERTRLEESAALGEITETQKLHALVKLKDEEFQIEVKAAQDRAELLQADVVAYQQAMDKILEIKQKHELDKAKMQKDIKIAEKKEFDDMFSPIEKAFEKSMTGMIQGTQTMRQAMRNMVQSILAEYANMGVKMLVQWVANQARMTMATASGTAARGGIEAAAATQSMALSGQTSFKAIMNDAYESMAGAYKAIAGIPFVGPFLAPVVAAGAFAAVAGLAGSVMSARGGYDIPAGVNPMTQLHEEEMVLPAEHANTIRSMSDNGGGTGGDIHMHVHTQSTKDFETFLMQNSHALAPAVRRMSRNYTPLRPGGLGMGRKT